MADDKLKTGPEPPGPDRPGDAPAKEAPPIQEPPVQETDAPGKTQEPAAPGTGPALQAEQSVIPGMGEDNPARSALGEVVVDFDKINELMSQRRAAGHRAVDKLKAPATDKDGKEAPIPEEKAPEADQPKKRRGRPPKEQAGVSAEKKEKAAEPRTGRPSKVDKAAREEAPPAVRDKVSRGRNLPPKWAAFFIAGGKPGEMEAICSSFLPLLILCRPLLWLWTLAWACGALSICWRATARTILVPKARA